MKRILFFLILPILMTGISSETRSENPLRIRFHVFSLVGPLKMDTKLQEDFKTLWNDSEKDWLELQGRVTLMDEGTFQFGQDMLTIDKDGCYWNRQLIPFEEKNPLSDLPSLIRLIYSPIVVLEHGELSSMKINSIQRYDYFVERSDRLFECRQMDMPTGMEVVFNPKEKKGSWILDDMEITIRAVGNREPVNGTTLPVGKPLLSMQKFELDLKIRMNKFYGVLLQLESQFDYILLCFDIVNLDAESNIHP